MAVRDRVEAANGTFGRINITNLVDVALTLVVILLMIAPFVEQGIEVRLPSSAPGKISVESSVIVTVARDRVYYLGSRKVSLDELVTLLRGRRAADPKTSVVVKGDERAAYGDVMEALSAVQTCEITIIGLATRPEDTGRRR